MRHLGIVSDAHHYLGDRGQLCTLTPLARQFEQWATLFDRVTVLAPLLTGQPPSSCDQYGTTAIGLSPLPVAGGNTTRAKVNLLCVLPIWWQGIRQLLRTVDAVHIRCPNNVGIPALLAVARTSVPRQAAFTGTWMGYAHEPPTYRWQRWYLSRWFKGPVAVYGEWPDQPPHVVASFSPSFSDAEWQSEESFVREKLGRLSRVGCLPGPIKLVTIGSLSKNQDVVIRTAKTLVEWGLEIQLDVLGGGPQQVMLDGLVKSLGLEGCVRIHGRVAHSVVRAYLRAADFAVQAPSVEGFGKVPIEALFHGTVPIISDVNLSSQLVGHGCRGAVFRPGDYIGAASAVADLSRGPNELMKMIYDGRRYVRKLSLECWRDHLHEMLKRHWSTYAGSNLRTP